MVFVTVRLTALSLFCLLVTDVRTAFQSGNDFLSNLAVFIDRFNGFWDPFVPALIYRFLVAGLDDRLLEEAHQYILVS